MIPLKDYRPSGKTPIISYLLIFLSVLAFGLEVWSPEKFDLINRWSLIAAKINFFQPATLMPFLTHQFLHAGFFHLLSNIPHSQPLGKTLKQASVFK